MTESKEYDIAVIGGGPGGYVAAIRASQLGAKVALVEKDRLGGTCLNRGCIPTKALVKSAETLVEVKRAGEFGINVALQGIDFAKVMARKKSVVDTLVNGVGSLMKSGKIDVYHGAARLLSPRSIKVNDQDLTAKKVIIATGSISSTIPVPGIDLPGVLTSDTILELDHLPASLAVIGGGVIGMEFANIFAVLGSKVTVIEMLPQILPPVDEEIARRYAQIARTQGIDINVSSTVKEIKQAGPGLEVMFDTAKGPQQVQAEKALLSVGRWPYTGGLELEKLGIKMNRRAIAVNSRMETSVEGVYAIGDVIGGIMLAHVASYEGEIAVDNALGHPNEADYRSVPNCIFTLPEIAGVGLTEKEAKDKGLAYKVSKFPFTALGRAHSMGETAGLVKMVCEAEGGKILGIHILGPHATDMIAEGALAIQFDGTAKDIAYTIHAHPTLPEAVFEAALGQLHGAIHYGKM